MKTVRQQILEYVEARRVVSAEEISRAFKIGAANARYHLSVLVAEGAVEISGVTQDGSPGRPRQRYAPTRQTRRHNLNRLASALLAESPGKLPKEKWLERLANHIWIADDIGKEWENLRAASNPTHLTHRLAQVIRRLNRMNYDARWEAHAQAPRIIFNHCPYAAIIDEHPELCQMDALLLQKALGLSVSQQVKLGKDSQGLPYCMFQLASRKHQVNRR